MLPKDPRGPVRPSRDWERDRAAMLQAIGLLGALEVRPAGRAQELSLRCYAHLTLDEDETEGTLLWRLEEEAASHLFVRGLGPDTSGPSLAN